MNAILKPALELDRVSIQYSLELKPAEARRFAYGCEWHGIEPAKLRRLIKDVDGLIPRMNFGLLNGKPNANNGHPHHWYTVGKEYSRVLYVKVIKVYLHDFDYGKLTRQLEKLARSYGADEGWTTENDETAYTFRFWWD